MTNFIKKAFIFILTCSFSMSIYARAINKVVTIVNHTTMPISFHSTGSFHVISSELFTDGEIAPGATKRNKIVIDDDAGSPRINLEFKANNEKVLNTRILFYRDNVDSEQINTHYFISTKYNQDGMTLDILTDCNSY